jgi:hypothetical protein
VLALSKNFLLNTEEEEEKIIKPYFYRDCFKPIKILAIY